MILFAIGHPPKGLRRGAPSACLPQAGFNIVPRHFSGPSELRLNYSCVSAERKAGSSDRHGSQNEMGTRTPASPPQTNGETTSRPLLNHAVNLSRLSTPSRAERQTKWSLSSAACLEPAGFQVGAAALRFRAFRQRSRRSATGLDSLNKKSSRE